MTPQPSEQPDLRHVWISNAAFSRMTGVKKVCLTCGQPSNNATAVCPGKRPSR